ncbi:MAG TPA: hypothetical protein VF950_22540 [Planctomycetota bacterium]
MNNQEFPRLSQAITLFRFSTPGKDFDETAPDAMTEKISTYFGKGKPTRCLYQYDFGGGWELDPILEDVVSRPDKLGRQLLEGARAFPPDD